MYIDAIPCLEKRGVRGEYPLGNWVLAVGKVTKRFLQSNNWATKLSGGAFTVLCSPQNQTTAQLQLKFMGMHLGMYVKRSG